jgi:WD40 repeat protein
MWRISHDELLNVAHKSPLSSAIFSPDGSRLVTAGNDRVAKVWDATSGKELFSLAGHEGTVSALASTAAGDCSQQAALTAL